MRRSIPAMLPLVFTLACDPGPATDETPDTDATDTTAPTDTTDLASACTVTPPTAYASADFDTNAADALTLRAALDALVGEMRDAETGAATVDEVSDLDTLFDAGTPSVSSVATTAYTAIVDEAFAEFVQITAAGDQDLVDDDDGSWSPGAEGGIFEESDRGIHEGGLEVRQLVDKGLFGGGAFYPAALALTEGTIDVATIDQIATFAGSDATLDPENVTDSSDYIHGMGRYAGLAAALIDARAYAADPECTAERDAAIVDVFRQWELGLMARFVYYANLTSAQIATQESDADLAAALHTLAEGVGLGLGFTGVADPTSGPLAGAGRVATDAEIEAMVGYFGVDPSDLASATTGEFVDDGVGIQAAVTSLEADIREIYELGAAEVVAMRAPTEG